MQNIQELVLEYKRLDLNILDYDQWNKHNFEGKSSTFVLTDACNLRCTYCYILDKPEGHVMTWEVAKKYVDYIFDLNKDLYLIPTEEQTPFEHAKIWDFVGGEPLLEYKLMFRIMDYIDNKTAMLPKNHPWKSGFIKENKHIDGYRYSLSSNGVLLSNPDIRKQFEIRGGNKKISLGISIDGPKELHDLCRKKTDGSGSYNDIMDSMKWWSKWFPSDSISTKATIAHENLPLINTICKFFFEEMKMKKIFINTVFENVWQLKDDVIFFEQLCELADWLIEEERYKNCYVSFFGTSIGGKKEENGKAWCGAGKHMDACGYDGKIYPCLRFKTLYNRKPMVIGTVDLGKDWSMIDKFGEKNAETMSNKTKELTGIDCTDCQIAGGCADCQGYSYDCLGDFFTKVTYICPMHGARFCANIYFFGRIMGFIEKEDKALLANLLEEINKDRRIHMK